MYTLAYQPLLLAARNRLSTPHFKRRVIGIHHLKTKPLIQIYRFVAFQHTERDGDIGVVCLPEKFSDQLGRDAATLVRRQDLNLHDAPLMRVPKEFEQPKRFGPATDYVCVVKAITKTRPMSVFVGRLTCSFKVFMHGRPAQLEQEGFVFGSRRT